MPVYEKAPTKKAIIWKKVCKYKWGIIIGFVILLGGIISASVLLTRNNKINCVQECANTRFSCEEDCYAARKSCESSCSPNDKNCISGCSNTWNKCDLPCLLEQPKCQDKC
jgi:hypothetical protein